MARRSQISEEQARQGSFQLGQSTRERETNVADSHRVLAGGIALALLIQYPGHYYRRPDCLNSDAANEAEVSAYAHWGE